MSSLLTKDRLKNPWYQHEIATWSKDIRNVLQHCLHQMTTKETRYLLDFAQGWATYLSPNRHLCKNVKTGSAWNCKGYTLDGSPPKAAIFSCRKMNAALWSCSPALRFSGGTCLLASFSNLIVKMQRGEKGGEFLTKPNVLTLWLNDTKIMGFPMVTLLRTIPAVFYVIVYFHAI